MLSVILSAVLVALIIVNVAMLYSSQRAKRKRLDNEMKFFRRRYQEDYDD